MSDIKQRMAAFEEAARKEGYTDFTLSSNGKGYSLWDIDELWCGFNMAIDSLHLVLPEPKLTPLAKYEDVLSDYKREVQKAIEDAGLSMRWAGDSVN